jgi:spore coat protein A, manganese oxidase
VYGDVILVNGRPWPSLQVEQRKYRFRILNASISRSYELSLSTGEPFTMVATDGGLMPGPQVVSRFRHAPAERYEVVIDFSKYEVGQRIELRNRSPKNNIDYDTTDVVMAFDVVGPATDTARNEVPAVLNPAAPAMDLTPEMAVKTRRFRFERKHGMWTINGQTWEDVIESDYEKVVGNPRLNDIEIWELQNTSGGWFHPVHIHLIDFKILDRNGRPPFAYELGPKDVAYVGENETVRVVGKFGPQVGKYMMHCHNLSHEDHDMMVQFEVGEGGYHPVREAPAVPMPAPEF